MAIVVFLRGVNVGGHRRFRPSMLAGQLRRFDAVNVGAAGTLVIRRPGPRAKFRAALLRRLPFETEIMFCEGRDLLRLEQENPFAAEGADASLVRFVGILSRPLRSASAIPFALPGDGEWFVRVIMAKGKFACGVYRRHMKTIGYLGRMDKAFGAPVTVRNWNTIAQVLRVLKSPVEKAARPPARVRAR